MPNFEVLYYPYFEPSQKWIRSHLLFFDTVKTIVPLECKDKLSESMLSLVKKIPDSFKPISPTRRDIQIDEVNIGRLEKALIQISKPTQYAMSDQSSYDQKLLRMAFLHNTKVSNQVQELLEKHNFINKDCQRLYHETFYLIDKRAANLIVSLVADKIASSNGISTITDQTVSYTLNFLNSFDHIAPTEPRSLLSYSLINCIVPNNIESLSIDDYVTIREKYENVREPFQEVITNLNSLYQFDKVQDKYVLQEKIIELTREFNSEIENIKESGLMSKIKYWSSIVIGGLGVGASAAGYPEVQLGIKTTELIHRVYKSSNPYFAPQSNKNQVQRMIGSLQKDIIKKSQIKALI